MTENRPTHRRWPVILLAAPAFVAVWSGWVGLGELVGFGVVHPLPGIADGFTINSAITLPVGVETYAAFALSVWLSGPVPAAARQFAKWSAIGSLILGALGQVAFHLLVAAGVKSAPWQITTVVSCLPVAVLGMGAALAHLLRAEPERVPLSGSVTDAASPEAVIEPARHLFAVPGQIDAAFTELDREQTRTAKREQKPARRPNRAAKTPAEQKPNRSRPAKTEQKPAASVRPDSELIEQVQQWCAEQTPEQNPGQLSRYRIEQITGAAARQADRVLSALTEQTEKESV